MGQSGWPASEEPVHLRRPLPPGNRPRSWYHHRCDPSATSAVQTGGSEAAHDISGCDFVRSTDDLLVELDCSSQLHRHQLPRVPMDSKILECPGRPDDRQPCRLPQRFPAAFGPGSADLCKSGFKGTLVSLSRSCYSRRVNCWAVPVTSSRKSQSPLLIDRQFLYLDDGEGRCSIMSARMAWHWNPVRSPRISSTGQAATTIPITQVSTVSKEVLDGLPWTTVSETISR